MNNEKETKNEKLTIYDAVLAIFYLIIIAIGIVMCINHGLGGTILHVIGIAVCIFGVFAAKLLKYRTEIKKHLGELVFIAVMCVMSVLTLIGTIV